MQKPSTPDEVRSLLGLATYCSRFIPNFSDLTRPLRVLTKKDIPWSWEKEHEIALETLKSQLSKETTLSYFDPAKTTTLFVDASGTGLGAILTQRDEKGSLSIISFASKALTDVETRYSQTEREALAVVYACEHYHLYVYGSPFTVVTDHLPLITLLGNPFAKTSARIERWNLRLAPYDMTLEYQPGKTNPADYLSRHPLPPNKKVEYLSPATEQHLNTIVQHAIPKAITYIEIAEATKADRTIQHVAKCLINNHWANTSTDTSIDWKVVQAFQKIKHELSMVNGILLKDHRIYVPTSLQSRVIAIAHEGHLGLVKTKQLLRTKVWFSGMDKQVDNLIRSCIPCLSASRHNVKEPLKMTQIPEKPWSSIAADHLGPFKNGQYLLVVIDEHSRFPVVESVSSTSVESNVKIFNRIFSLFGLVDVVKTDNGPPFNSKVFTDYLSNLGIKHQKITPRWPQANGCTERFMASLAKTIRAADVAARDWKDEIKIFLRNYRVTPHCTTGQPPSTLMFGRTVKSKLPTFPNNTTPVNSSSVTELEMTDGTAKRKMKAYSDKRHLAKPHALQIGDDVLVKTTRSNKMSPFFSPLPYRVTKVKGSTVTAERDGFSVTRNSSFFKRTHPPTSLVLPPNNDLSRQATPPAALDPTDCHDESPRVGSSLHGEDWNRSQPYRLRPFRVKPKRLIEEM